MVLNIKACHLCEGSVRSVLNKKNMPFTEKKSGRALVFTVQMQSPNTYQAGSLTNTCLNKLTFPYHEAKRDSNTVACSSVA